MGVSIGNIMIYARKLIYTTGIFPVKLSDVSIHHSYLLFIRIKKMLVIGSHL